MADKNAQLWHALDVQEVLAYAPFLQRAMHTDPMMWTNWALLLAFAAPILHKLIRFTNGCFVRGSAPNA